MNKLRLLALWCVAAFAAGCALQPVTVTGTVCDATANGLMLVADGAEPIFISTMYADSATTDGILLYDSVMVTYVEQRSVGVSVRKARSLDVIFSPYTAIVGRWVEPNTIDTERMQGIEINADGTAASIGMATLRFKSWDMTSPQTIVFGLESIGNGASADFTDTFRIETFDGKNLILSQNGNIIWNLHKEKTKSRK